MKRTIAYVLIAAALFLAGRAEGWYESHVFMAKTAKSLGVVVQNY